MARKRQIDPEFCVDEDMAGISLIVRLFYILSWIHAEDTGVLENRPVTLKAKIFPYDDINIVPLIDELTLKGKFILYTNGENREYLFIKNFHKHQTIRHPSTPKLPLPPEPYFSMIPKSIIKKVPKTLLEHRTTVVLPQCYGSPAVVRTQSRVEESRVEESRVKEKAGPSAALQAALDKVFKDGFNIYALLTKTKTQLKQPVGFEFPEPVLLKVCDAYWREKLNIRAPWPWFVKVLADEWTRWNVDQQISQGEAYKKEPMAASIAEILRRLIK